MESLETNMLYAAVICFFAGVYGGLHQWVGGEYYGACFAAGLLLLALAFGRRYGRITAALFCCCLLLWGLANGLRTLPDAAQQLQPLFGRQVVAYGRLEPLSVRRAESYTSFIIKCDIIQCGQRQLAYSGRLRASVANGEALPEAGKIAVSGLAVPLTSLRNPGSFDSALYNKVQHLGGRLKQARLLAVNEEVGLLDRLALLNKKLSDYLERKAGSEAGSLLAGMVLGGSQRLPEELREVFAANGLAHLLSVSGTHLVLLTALLSMLLRPIPQPWRNGCIILVLLLYASLCGLRPPVLRALLMSAAVLAGGSGAQRGRLLLLAAVVLLLCEPWWLLDIGMQLSFGASAGLIWLLPACRRAMPACLPEFIGEGMAVTLAAQLGIVPLLLGYFHQLPLISLASNILLVPVLEVAALLALSGCLLPWADFLLSCAVFLTEQAIVQAEWLAAVPYGTLTVGTLPLWCTAVYYMWLLAWADLPVIQLLTNRQRQAVMYASAAVLAAVITWQQLRTVPLTFYFLDVGQGDCTVVVTPGRQVIVCDTGGLPGMSTGSRIVAPFLRSLGYDTIDLLLLSHFDFDHVGGADGLLRNIKVQQLLLPNEQLTQGNAALYQRILRLTDGSRIQIARPGQQWELDAVKLLLADVPVHPVSGNEASTLAAVKSPWGSLLLTGDMGEEREQGLQLDSRYTVLKAGHHGSRFSSSGEFLQQVQPRLSIISCGAGNRYGHPHPEVLERLRDAGSRVLRTDQEGCIRVELTDAGIKCYGYSDNFWQRLPSS